MEKKFSGELIEIFYSSKYTIIGLYAETKGKLMNNLKPISLFFAVDDNYCPFLSVALDSIVKNCNKLFSYNIYVLCTNISNMNIKTISNKLPENFNIHFVDVNEKLNKFNEQLHTRDYYSKTTYYRLFIPEMFPDLDKALDLDSDISVLGDISELYNTDLQNNLVGAVPDAAVQNTPVFIEYVKKVIGVKFSTNYFNAGVLLMNLKEMRKFDFENKFLKLLSAYKFTVAQDQDYLNAICLNKVTYCDYSWNVMPIPNDCCKPSKINLIHFNMLWKPWIFENTEYEEYFWQYAKNNPYLKKIKKIQTSYTYEIKQTALKGGEMLLQLARQEADNPNNYKNKFLNK